MLRTLVLGISHKTAPVEIRELFSFSQESLEGGVRQLLEKDHIEECAILSTCNRVEIYAVSENVELCLESMKEFLSEFHDVPEETFSPHIYYSIGHMAVRHLFKVASSIDSMVVGEPQVLGQVKESYKIAAGQGTAGLILNRLFHTSFFVAKRIRTETGIGSHAVSISYVAVELAKRIFDDLSKRSVMLVGAGEMAEIAARHLIKAGISDLLIASRQFENAAALSEKLNGKAISYDEVFYHLKDVDIVITATGSQDFIIKPNHVKEALKLRNNNPMFLIDIAVPRDIDPRIEDISDIYLYDIDDLKNVSDENIKTRQDSSHKAEEIILEVERSFETWLSGLKAVPAIIDLKKRFEIIKDSELEKALAKLEGLSEADRYVIELMASRIIGKLLHNPLTNIKKESSTSLGALYVDSIKKLFNLEKELLIIEEEEDEASLQDWN
ncbi:MAG: glutamyl-tRNA reductase [Deltaproteobacteria bacterium]|nr:glutamyl-tRNA reductase [Deltaproteobacteria bacterium]